MDYWQTHERMNQEQKGTKIVRKRTCVSLCAKKIHHSCTYLSIICWSRQWPLLLAIGLYQIPPYDRVGNLGMIRIFIDKILRGLRIPQHGCVVWSLRLAGFMNNASCVACSIALFLGWRRFQPWPACVARGSVTKPQSGRSSVYLLCCKNYEKRHR